MDTLEMSFNARLFSFLVGFTRRKKGCAQDLAEWYTLGDGKRHYPVN